MLVLACGAERSIGDPSPSKDSLLVAAPEIPFEHDNSAAGEFYFPEIMGAAVADYDGDGWLDLYVTNAGPNQLWRNPGDFMTHLDGETHTLYRGDGEGLFSDRTTASGLAAPTRPVTGFGAAALDVDLDGWRDLYVANGAVYTIESQRREGDPFPFRQPDHLFVSHHGESFEAVENPAGERSARVGRGVAAGDLLRTGTVSLVAFDSGATSRRLEPRRRGRWVGVVPRVTPSRSLEAGSVVLELEGGPRRHARINRDGSYASSSDAAVVFGLGDAEPVRLSIDRPNAVPLTFSSPPLERYLVVPATP